MGQKKPIAQETKERITRVLGWVRSPEKHCQVTPKEILDSLRNNGQFRHTFPIPESGGVNAQLNVQGSLEDSKKESLSVSVKIDGERVLGVDYAIVHEGFHKHEWTPENRDDNRTPLPQLNQIAPHIASEELLQEMFSAIGIKLEDEAP